ncbi:hypothetical protein AN963_24960 [Brevibacillus choshinensis]|uniref:Diacylglyceryl transferase n=1 Tax=Brevibacillus choshinensis TaxID=54911 RepID=A0ABR5N2A9_BRECH|nr:hypothetical protein [Brevibacillus choshinensis]KQL44625.1 hypothetical protein AN963_24960 [Brevibacillus choshinensis]
MPDVIQFGPFLIKMSMLAIAVPILSAFVAVYFRLRKEKEQRKTIFELITSSLLLAFFVWKFSYALFYPAKVWAQPASLLYFSGGDRGILLGVLAVSVYLVVKVRRQGIPIPVLVDVFATGGLTAWAVGHVLTWGVEQVGGWYSFQQAFIAIVFLLWVIRKLDRATSVIPWLQMLLWFGICQVYVTFFSPDYAPLLVGLSKEQLLYYIFSVLALFLANRARDTGGTPNEE